METATRISELIRQNAPAATAPQPAQQPKPQATADTPKVTLTYNRFKSILNRHREELLPSSQRYEIENAAEWRNHYDLLIGLGNNMMGREFRQFIVDENNIKVIQFLLFYFHRSPHALKVFPERNYGVHKNLFLVGDPGTGKTMIMQVFAEYLKHLNMNNRFYNTSLTEMLNYQKIHNHIDRFTYNELEKGGKMFEGSPVAVCLNDIGLATEKQKSYGTSLETILDEFLFARYEIYQNRMINYHLTSNLSVQQCQERFEGRLMDRFKTFNVIPLTGSSRR